MDYKATLNLPDTAFPMKADLPKREPELVERWHKERLYARILEARANAPKFVFHDGPPYANGHIHYGHILNKTLKDLVCKFQTMLGRSVEFKPGWDCHGLPIELAVQRELGKDASALSAIDLRRACDAYARTWVATQASEFERIGVFATWDAPYLTLDKSYEATIVRQLGEFAKKGILYQAQKPVHWCTTDHTALAEAEIEYDEHHVSPSIYVKFALPEPGLFAVIWTTTPWTLPANYAIAYHPAFDYVTVARGSEKYIVAAKLADAFVKACGITESGAREPFPVEKFAALKEARHPFMDRASLLLPAEHVTLEQGTGLVHTAPGHGQEDYELGKKYGLPISAPVDDGGKFSSGPWVGEHIWKANPKIVAALHESGALLSPPDAKVTHSYPICWRCKNPVVFRATHQWFAALDDHNGIVKSDLRDKALTAIGQTQWIPPWGQARIEGMIAHRPDWVLSRQRAWGVPIPVLVRRRPGNNEERDAVFEPAWMERIAAIFAREGADAWFTKSVAELFGDEVAAKYPDYEKGQDIVDVWFESGVSWAAVCTGRLSGATATDPRPVDLYLEGSDQHRGWFHSALLTSAATTGHAPYRAVLTHGFVLDERGRPYSKSEIEKARREGKKVEFIPPEDVIKSQGAELLRLWVAQADFRNDVAYSRSHLTQLGEAYRKVRNTARFLLGNLQGFDATHTSGASDGGADDLDRYLEARIRQFVAATTKAYADYEFHTVFRLLVELCTTELSALYLDVRKDRLYCDGKNSATRRATQAVLYRALRAVTLQMAPILCFTAEEIWGYLPKRAGDPDSVHLALFDQAGDIDAQALAKLEPLLGLRAQAHHAMEPFRAQKKAPLDAHLHIPRALVPLDTDLAFLCDLLIVSQITIVDGDELTVTEASGHKCERCWKWTPDEPICTRCRAALAGAHTEGN